jgi:two-component system OmpR family response regulator
VGRGASFRLGEVLWVVDVADTGEKALELGRDVSYDAILLDVRLPGMSGIEVCRELRQRGVEAPVMMLTARTLVEQRVEGLAAGADDYLTKPFAFEEFGGSAPLSRSGSVPRWISTPSKVTKPYSPPCHSRQRDHSPDFKGVCVT